MTVRPDTLEITGWSGDGDGTAQVPAHGLLVFPGTVPGDAVSCDLRRVERTQRRVTTFLLERPSEQRTELPCVSARACGGCKLIELDASVQRRVKQQYVLDELCRVQLGKGTERVSWTYAETTLGYRNRLRLQVRADGSVTHFNENKPTDCAVLEPDVRDAGRALREMISGVDQRSVQSPVLRGTGSLELRAPDLDRRLGLWLVPDRRATHPLPSVSELEARLLHLAAQTRYAHLWQQLVLGIQTQAQDTEGSAELGRSDQRYPLTERLYHYVPLGSFRQVNAQANAALIAAITTGARHHRVSTFLDLFCGAGNLSLPLLAGGATGVAVDTDARGIAAARRSAQEQGLDADCFRVADARTLSDVAPGVELVIADAPRAGLGPGGLQAVLAARSRHVALCSCNPRTLARDLRALCDAGFAVERVELFEMFPHTHHVESLAWLTRDLPGELQQSERAAPEFVY